MHIAVSVGALLISIQLCLASDARREAAQTWWSGMGEQVKAELKRLPEAGRRAFREAPMSATAMPTGPRARER